MKKLLFICLIYSLLISTKTLAQDADYMAEAQKVWMEYMTPGDVHKMLASHAGEWKTDIKFWMAPGTEPMVSEGTATNEMILGGRYLVSKNSGTSFGMPMEGMSIEGYDNATKEFTSVWVDNMGTGTMVLKGKWNEEENSIDYKGEMVDPMTGSYMNVTEKMTNLSADSQKLEMWMEMEGQMFKSMEIVFTRIK
ncbi:MAG: DUF1579 domain-containing protein [Melioribacteraceae bacterium]|nr:DUF1579 domain-containing protein [Melioribacteraceae bacterium]MCF8412894.1 DUF1579 domain-containing protein [Melioribacteraceae bacterium]